MAADGGTAGKPAAMDKTDASPMKDGDGGMPQEPGNVFAAWPMPDALPGALTAPSFGTRTNAVIDTVTHLEWQADLPKVYPGCTGMHPESGSVMGDCCTWAEAAAYCKQYGEQHGQMGWRLPTKIELESIVDETKYSPSIDSFYFPNTPNHGYWTSTMVAGMTGKAYYVGFATGLTSYGEVTSKTDVRCVR